MLGRNEIAAIAVHDAKEMVAGPCSRNWTGVSALRAGLISTNRDKHLGALLNATSDAPTAFAVWRLAR
jgi:hypothetical protein